MSEICVIGIGVFPSHLNREHEQLLLGSDMIVLQTGKCYLSSILTERGVGFQSFDHLYDNAEDFDQLNNELANRLCEFAKQSDGGRVLYAVPGKAIGLPAVKTISSRAGQHGIEFRVIQGIGFGDAALASAAGLQGFEDSAQQYFAGDFAISGIGSGDSCMDAAGGMQQGYEYSAQQNFFRNAARIDCNHPLCIQEIDSRLIAGEIKLKLQDYYPDELEVLLSVAGKSGYELRTVRLFEIDRMPEESYVPQTCVLLPALSFEKKRRFGQQDLAYIIRRLRAPGGCPWDREQSHESIRRDLLEEAYEVVEAIDHKDDDMLAEELGDLLMQVYFHAEMARERSAFGLRDITTGICEKLIYRHPHVFGAAQVDNTEQVLDNWDKLKRAEKQQETYTDTLKAVPLPLPALMRAAKLQKKAAKAGFDWPDVSGAIEKAHEEKEEFLEVLLDPDGALERRIEEMGDWLFSIVNVARLSGLDPEMCLLQANNKFLKRFELMEQAVINDGKQVDSCDLQSLDQYWNDVKQNKM